MKKIISVLVSITIIITTIIVPNKISFAETTPDSDITYSTEKKLSEDKKSVDIKINLDESDRVEITEILMPDGKSVKSSGDSIEYTADKNGDYNFNVYYKKKVENTQEEQSPSNDEEKVESEDNSGNNSDEENLDENLNGENTENNSEEYKEEQPSTGTEEDKEETPSNEDNQNENNVQRNVDNNKNKKIVNLTKDSEKEKNINKISDERSENGLIPISVVVTEIEEEELSVSNMSEWNETKEKIEMMPEGSSVVVKLTGHINHTGEYKNGYKVMYVGVEGRHITYKSSDGGPYIIATYGLNMYAKGDVTFENVWLNKSQSSGNNQGSMSSFYAMGHTVEFSENFSHRIANLYGGAKGESVNSTHLIINGDIKNSDNASDSQNSKVFGGGEYDKNSSKTGDVTESTIIDLGIKANTPWIYGGGENSQVGKNVTINLNGGKVENITGGGRATDDGPSDGKKSGTILGNVNLNLNSGQIRALSSGGGSNELEITAKDVSNKNSKYYLYRATIGGDVNINMGGTGGNLVQTSENAALCGSIYSVIQGNLNVNVDEGTQLPQDLFSMGINDTVEGNINLVMNGGNISGGIWGLGEAYYTSGGTHTVGKSNNGSTEGGDINIIINGGNIEYITWHENIVKNAGVTNYTEPHIYGNIEIEINDGNIKNSVYIGNPEKKSPIAVTGYKLPYVYGDKGIELYIRGGNIGGLASIYVHQLSRIYNGQRIYFENDEPIELYQIDSANSNKNQDKSDIIVKNTAPVSIKYYKSKSGVEYQALNNCGSINIEKGNLALGGSNTIAGNLTIGDNAILSLNTTSNEITENSSLNVLGNVSVSPESGTSWLKTVKPYKYSWATGSQYIKATDEWNKPIENEVYIRSNNTNEKSNSGEDSSLIDLYNKEGGLYVEYNTDNVYTTDSYKHSWKISKDINYEEVLVKFDKNGGDTEANPNVMNAEKGKSLGKLPQPPSKKNAEFIGWNAKEDGSGNVFNENTIVNENITVYAQWEEKKDELKVSHKFVSGTPEKELPEDVTKLLPKDYTVPEGSDVKVNPENFEDIGTDQGVWVFRGWDKTEVKDVKEDVVFTGTWEYYEMQEVVGENLVVYEGGLGSGNSQDTGDALPEPTWKKQIGDYKVTVDGEDYDISKEGLPFSWEYRDGDGNKVTSSARVGEYGLFVFPKEELKGKKVVINNKVLNLPTEGIKVSQVSVRDVTDNEGADNLSDEIFKAVYNYNAPKDTDFTKKIAEGIERIISGITRKDGDSALDGNFNDSTGTHNDNCNLEEPHAHVAEGTEFLKNGKDDFHVNDNAKIGLLWDEFIPEVLGKYIDKIHEKSMNAISNGTFDQSENIYSDYQYIDPVDMNDGNVWVGTKDDKALTIYCPYSKMNSVKTWGNQRESEKPDADDKIVVTYFTGLTRDYTINMNDSELSAEIEGSSAKEIEVRKTDTGILFDVPSEQFGPFELMWQKTEGGGSGTTDPIEPTDPINPNEPEKPTDPTNPDDSEETDKPEESDKPDKEDDTTDSEESKPSDSNEHEKDDNGNVYKEIDKPKTGDAGILSVVAVFILALFGVVILNRRKKER